MQNLAYNDSIKLLCRKDYSEYKLRKKLIEKNHSQEDIDEAIDSLIEMKYLREEEYRRARVLGLLYKGYAPRYIIQKMNEEKCPTTEHEIYEIMEEKNLNLSSQVQMLVEKKQRFVEIDKLSYEEKSKLKAKTMRYLISKGYQYDNICNFI